MYLHLLDEQERIGFLALAKELLNVDEEYCEAERNALSVMLNQFGLSEKEISAITAQSARDSIFRHKAKIVSLVELGGLAFVDTDFCEEERQFLFDLACQWKIAEGILNQIIRWVVQLVNLDDEIQQLMEEGE